MFTFSSILTDKKLKHDRQTQVRVLQGPYKGYKGVITNASPIAVLQSKLTQQPIAVDVSAATDPFRTYVLVSPNDLQVYTPYMKIVRYEAESSHEPWKKWSESEANEVRAHIERLLRNL